MADEVKLETETAPETPKLASNVTIADSGPARKKIIIEIAPERIAEKLGSNMKDLQTEAVLPGFRRGRAPMRLIEKRFGKDVRSEAKAQLMGGAYQEVIEEKKLRVLGEPDIKDADKIELPASGSLTFEVEVEVAPEFELPELEGLEINKVKISVTDAQVDAEVSRYQEMYGTFKAVEDAAELGDYLTAAVKVKNREGEVVDDQPAATVFVAGESRKFKGVVAGILIEDLGHKLEGKTIGQTVTLEATGPKQHENEKLRDAALTIDIQINKIERLQPVPMDELLKSFGMESEDKLREQIKTGLQQRAEVEQQSGMRKQVADILLSKVSFELPEGLSSRQAGRVMQRRAMDLMYRGASQQDIEQNLAELRASSEEEARKELKQFFIFDKVAEKYEVEVGEGEINGRIAQMAAQQGQRPEKMRQEMVRSGRLDNLFIQMREQKTIDKLIEKAKITEVDAPASVEEPVAKKTTKKKATKSEE
ncbi:MAG: trigger factor [Phycisphaerales bacterium]